MANSLAKRRYAHGVVASAALALVALAVAGERSCAEPNKQIIERAQHYKDDVLKLWERLVNIDSGTGDEQGLKEVGAIATEELKKLGAAIEIFPAKPAIGDNVVASFVGTGKGRALLIAHMDTVFAPGTAAARPFRIKDGRAYGPGVSDNKGGMIAALFVLRILQDLNFKDYAKITLLLNTNEETGSLGTRLLIENLAKQHDATLNLEAGRPGDGLVIWRKGSGSIKVEVKGRAATPGWRPITAATRQWSWLINSCSWASSATAKRERPSILRCSRPATARTSFPTTRWRRATYGPSAARNSIELNASSPRSRRTRSFPIPRSRPA